MNEPAAEGSGDVLVIVNPRAGGADDLSRVVSEIRRHPSLDDPEVRITGGRDDARLFAEAGTKHGFRRIFSVGGDGTLNEVLNGIMAAPDPARAGTHLGVLPLGTGNDFARSVGVPLDLEEALNAVERLEPRDVDVVRVEGPVRRYFINASAGGFSGELDEEVTAERKRSWGPLAYLRGALEVLPDLESYRVELSFDEGDPVAVTAVNVAVANGRTAAGGLPIAPRARLDDGRIDVVVVREASLSRLLALAPKGVVGKHLEDELTEHFEARTVDIRSEPEMPFNVDGELVGTTPMRYEVVRGGLQVLAGPEAPAF